VSAARQRDEQPCLAPGSPHARSAVRHLSRVCTPLGKLIARIGPYQPTLTPNPFIALVASVVQQQVSLAAASAVYNRLRERCPRKRVTPAAVNALSPDDLRGVGLSRQKATYVLNVAEAFASRRLTAAKLRRMSDEAVVAATTKIKGIGRWTAEMLLIFCLQRPDVWPVDDLGLRKAVRGFLGLSELPPLGRMQALAEPWRPYRTCAAWYLWRSLGGPLTPGVGVATRAGKRNPLDRSGNARRA
jgi:DNA-3-methyladenine glycosylase II